MELFLARHDHWEQLYNCSGIDVDSLPLEQRRRFVPESIVTMVLCVIYYTLYVPCMFSIWKHRQETSYKLLFYIGIIDLIVLWIPGFLNPLFCLLGTVFCSAPVFFFFIGLVSECLWMAESSADLILGIHRCVEILSPRAGNFLFAGWRVYAWICLTVIYALYWLLLILPPMFTPLMFAFSLNPFEGYRTEFDEELLKPLLIITVHEIMIAVVSPLTYLLFAIALCVLLSKASKLSIAKHKMAFLQVFAISAMNAFSCSIFILKKYMEVGQLLTTMQQFTWFHIHGFPPVIYLCLNKTIREDCRVMFYKVFRPSKINHVHGVTIVQQAKPVSSLSVRGNNLTISVTN